MWIYNIDSIFAIFLTYLSIYIPQSPEKDCINCDLHTYRLEFSLLWKYLPYGIIVGGMDESSKVSVGKERHLLSSFLKDCCLFVYVNLLSAFVFPQPGLIYGIYKGRQRVHTLCRS